MRIEFEVGEKERHRVVYNRSAFWGNHKITVDGAKIKRDSGVSLKTKKRFEFTVGTDEQHAVVIENQREVLFGALRPQTFTVYVDGNVLQTQQGL